MRRVSWHVAAVIAVLVTAAAATGAFLRSGREVDEGITSVALGGRVHARVILPTGYDDVPHRRFPVVYFLHGLPGSSSSYQGNDWLLDAIQQAGPTILVLPQGARDGDTDPEYLDWGVGRNWATYVSTELPRYIDTHFRTIARRSGRAIVGVSAGGYGAAVTGFSPPRPVLCRRVVVRVLPPDRPTGTRALARGRLAIVHRLIGALKRDLRRRPTFVAFYVGRGDSRFRAENDQFDGELTEARVPHLFEVYAGAHNTALWQRHAAGWLRLALTHLAKPP